MLRHAAVSLLLLSALALTALPAGAQSEDDVYNRIEQLHGNADGFDEAFRRLTDAMRFGDPATVADLGTYPLTVNANGESYSLLRAQDLIDNYDSLVTQATRDAVADQAYGALFVNSDGVMFADGALWMSAICDTEDCSRSHWSLISINN